MFQCGDSDKRVGYAQSVLAAQAPRAFGNDAANLNLVQHTQEPSNAILFGGVADEQLAPGNHRNVDTFRRRLETSRAAQVIDQDAAIDQQSSEGIVPTHPGSEPPDPARRRRCRPAPPGVGSSRAACSPDSGQPRL